MKEATKPGKKEELAAYFSKNSLGDFDKVSKYFNFLDLDPENITLDNIRHKIMEKAVLFSKLLEELLQPEASIQCLYECKSIDEDKRKDIFDMYRMLKKMERGSDLLDLESNDSQNKEFIKDAFSRWEGIKNKLKPLLQELKDSWENPSISVPFETGYMG